MLFCNRHRHVAKTSILATIALEHLVDFLAMVGMIFIVIFFADVPPEVAQTADAIGVLGVALLVTIWIMVHKPSVVLRLMWAIKFFPKFLAAPLENMLDSAVEIFGGLRSPMTAFWISFSSLVQWFSGWVIVAAFLAAVHLDQPWYVALLILAVGNLGTMIPMTPGNIGVAHALYVLVLIFFDTDMNSAFAFAVLFHGISLVFVVLAGLAAMWYYHLPLKALSVPEGDTGLS